MTPVDDIASPPSAPRPRRPALPPPPSPSTERDRRRARGNWRKTLFRVHGWLGLNTGLLLFVICFSGSIATVSSEIDRMVDPAMRVDVLDAPYNWTAMHESLREAFPRGSSLGVYAPLEPGFAALAYVSLPTGETRKAYLNPYTGTLQGHTSFFNVHRFFRSFHRRFFDGYRGITLVTLMGFVLLASAVSGLVFYRGWIKQLFTLRGRRGRRLLWSDLHKTGGIWVLLFTLLIALTGIFYFVEEQMQQSGKSQALLPPPLPDVREASLQQFGPQPALLPASTYAEAAKRAFPDLEIRSMRLPQSPTDPVYVDGQAGNPITRDRANKVLLHPFTGEVIGIQRSSELGVVPFITDAVDPLHFGYFGGLPTKLLWLVLGLLLSFSVLSGTYLWVLRLATARQGHTSVWLRGALVSVVLTLAYFALIVFATMDGIRAYAPQRAAPQSLEQIAVGPYDVTILCDRPCAPTDGARYRLQFHQAGLPNYAAVTLMVEDEQAIVADGPARFPTAMVQSGFGDAIGIRIETRDGTFYTSGFEAPQATLTAEAAPPGMPDSPPGVWSIVAAFTFATIGFIGLWLYLILRAHKAVSR